MKSVWFLIVSLILQTLLEGESYRGGVSPFAEQRGKVFHSIKIGTQSAGFLYERKTWDDVRQVILDEVAN